MIDHADVKKSIAWPSNEEIINIVLKAYDYSKQSQATRKSCLNYFLEKKYNGYEGHIFNINKSHIKKYINYLKNNGKITLRTKKTKYSLLRSFLLECEDYFEDEYGFTINFPNKIIWKGNHKESESNVDVFLTIDEIRQILDHLKHRYYKFYLIFRLMAESGLRKGGVIGLRYDNVYLGKRCIITKEKNGKNAYYLSAGMVKHLKLYLKERELIKIDEKALFLSTHLKKYNLRRFNKFIKGVTEKLGIKKNVSCQVFRRSLNKLRFDMGCRDPILSILLCQSVKGVNFNNYIKKGLDYTKFLNYYDTWNPYANAGIQL